MKSSTHSIAGLMGSLAAALVVILCCIWIIPAPAAQGADKPTNTGSVTNGSLLNSAFRTGAELGWVIGANFGTKQDIELLCASFDRGDIAAATAILNRVTGRPSTTNSPAKTP